MKKIYVLFLIFVTHSLHAEYYMPEYSGIDRNTGFFLENSVIQLNKLDGAWGVRLVPGNRWIQTLDNIIIPNKPKVLEELINRGQGCKLKKFDRIDFNYNLSLYIVDSIECGYAWSVNQREWLPPQ